MTDAEKMTQMYLRLSEVLGVWRSEYEVDNEMVAVAVFNLTVQVLTCRMLEIAQLHDMEKAWEYYRHMAHLLGHMTQRQIIKHSVFPGEEGACG